MCSSDLFIWALIAVSSPVYHIAVIFPYRLRSYRVAGSCCSVFPSLHVYLPLRMICTHLERSFPQGFYVKFSATLYISDFYSSCIMWDIISLLLLVEFLMLLKDFSLSIISVHMSVGSLYNPLRVISLGLYSTASLYRIYSKASQHLIALFSHGLPYRASSWTAVAEIPWRVILALDKFYWQSLLVGQVASGSHPSLWRWHIQ